VSREPSPAPEPVSTGVRAGSRGSARRGAGLSPVSSPSMLPTAAYSGWEAIYTDNVSRIYRLMYSKVGNPVDAEDLTSQVFLDAFAPLRATASIGEVRAYLLATARTVLARHWRSTLGHQVTSIELDDVTQLDRDAGSDDHHAHETLDRIGVILAALPSRYREILTLRFLRGYTIKQAAAELDVSVANAKVLQHRALRQAAGLDDNVRAER
jgi:RNA polymerase sigma-70 factor, ECF subfamily